MRNYINPYHLLGFQAGPEIPDPKSLRKAKQRLMAEFDLSDEVVIQHQGKAIDRSSALHVLNELEDLRLRQLHWDVFLNPGLLNFLETGDAAIFHKLPTSPGFSPELLKFVSPAMMPVFSKLLTEAARLMRPAVVRNILAKSSYLLPADLDNAFQGIQKLIYLQIKEINERPIVFGNEGIAILKRHIEPSRLQIINMLPAHFQQDRNRYAEALYDFGIDFCNRWYRAPAIEVIRAALTVETDLAIRQKLEEMQLLMESLIQEQIPGNKTANTNPKRRSPDEIQRGCGMIAGLSFCFVIVIILLEALLAEFTGQANIHHVETSVQEVSPQDEVPGKNNLSFHKDLYSKLYDYYLLDKISPPKGGYGAHRPQSGDEPYKFKFSSDPAIKLQSCWTEVKNLSGRDAILFFNDPSNQIFRNVYVRSGDYFCIKDIPEGLYCEKIYSGTNWSPLAIHWPRGYPEKNVGAFDADTRFESNDNSLLPTPDKYKKTTANFYSSPLCASGLRYQIRILDSKTEFYLVE